MTINERVKEVRKKLEMNQTDFGASLSVSRGVINNYESGRTPPSKIFIDTLCRVHNVNIIWLETGEGEMFREKTVYQELAEFFGDVLNDEPESFRVSFLQALAGLDDNGWEMIAEECRIRQEFYGKIKKEQ